jgi:hypothetical protein
VSVRGGLCSTSQSHCELGCRADLNSSTLQLRFTGSPDADFAAAFCEEYRLENGPRRSGDVCKTDDDCLTYPPSAKALPYPIDFAQVLDDPRATPLHCDDGTCAELSAGAGGGGAGGEAGASGASR